MVDHPAQRRAAGFMAVELILAVVMTIVVAASIASAFRTHAIRTQVASGLKLASPWRSMVEVRFRQSGQVPTTWRDLYAEPSMISSSYVRTVELENGRIDIVYGNDAASSISGQHLSLMPYETADQTIVWICGDDSPGAGLQPLGFAAGGRQPKPLATTIEARYLPPPCR